MRAKQKGIKRIRLDPVNDLQKRIGKKRREEKRREEKGREKKRGE
jgi:hypothetical protein